MNVSPDAQQLRRAVVDCVAPGPVIVGCSGGPDSLALAASAQWAVPHVGGSVCVAVIDHGLQVNSADVAREAAETCRALGIDDVEVRRVRVGSAGGPEAAARQARRAALLEIAAERGAGQILLAHTRDDQAETVLLRLGRGSGARSLSAMRMCDEPWHRPFLDVPRSLVHKVAREYLEPLGRQPWDDPHNHDRSFARVRVRSSMEILEADLGPGIAASLARSARLLRDDADALDVWSMGEFDRVVHRNVGNCAAEVSALAELPRAVRSRVIRLMHQHVAGLKADLSFDHIQDVEALISRWKGQGPVSLPGPVTGRVECGRLVLTVHAADDNRE